MTDRERIAKWLFTFICDREDLELDWEEAKGYYLLEADYLLAYMKIARQGMTTLRRTS